MMAKVRTEARKEYERRWYAANIDRIRASQRRRAVERYARDPEKFKERSRRRREEKDDHLARRYGLTRAGRDAIFAKQGFACAICGADEPGNKRGLWHTDHDHKTGKVRGVLCGQCNTALGMARDDPSLLDLMAQYVRHHAR